MLLLVAACVVGALGSSGPRSASAAGATRGGGLVYVSTTGTDAGDGSDPSAPVRTIAFALDLMGAGGEIRLAQGIYVEHDLHVTTAMTLDGGWSDDFTTRVEDPLQTTINGDRQGRVLFETSFTGPDTLIVRNLTVRGGDAAQSAVEPARGGGIATFGEGLLVLEGARIFDNRGRAAASDPDDVDASGFAGTLFPAFATPPPIGDDGLLLLRPADARGQTGQLAGCHPYRAVIRPGGQHQLLCEVTNTATGDPAPAFLNVWIDLGGDGAFDSPRAHLVVDQQVPVGDAAPSSASFLVPADAAFGTTTFMRMRLSTDQGLGPLGEAPDGEVEDWLVHRETQARVVFETEVSARALRPQEPFVWSITATNEGPDTASSYQVLLTVGEVFIEEIGGERFVRNKRARADFNFAPNLVPPNTEVVAIEAESITWVIARPLAPQESVTLELFGNLLPEEFDDDFRVCRFTIGPRLLCSPLGLPATPATLARGVRRRVATEGDALPRLLGLFPGRGRADLVARGGGGGGGGGRGEEEIDVDVNLDGSEDVADVVTLVVIDGLPLIPAPDPNAPPEE